MYVLFVFKVLYLTCLCAIGVTSVLFVLWGFFTMATAYTLERIFTQNMSKDVVPGTEVPF